MKLGRADVCVVGAGAAGCVLAARLSERGDRSVCLVEAGPDYGHHDDGRWPADLLDASDCATSHDWGYGADVSCRVVGGSSAHNGCLVVWGTPADYDEWAAATGEEVWGWAGIAPLLARAEAAIATRRFVAGEVGAFTRAAMAGWHALGEPVLKPSSHGVVCLRTADPAAVPVIDQRLFSDPNGHDAAVLADGVELARAVAAGGPLGSLLRGPALPDALPGEAFTLYHPAGTCRMGRPGAPDTVVDAGGRVQGVDGLHVADASILPTIPRANTHLTVLAVAEAMAERLGR